MVRYKVKSFANKMIELNIWITYSHLVSIGK